MRAPRIVVFAPASCAPSAWAMLEPIIKNWPDRPSPRVDTIDPAAFHEVTNPPFDLAVLPIDSADPDIDTIDHLLETLDDWSIPLAVLHRGSLGERSMPGGEVYYTDIEQPFAQVRDRIALLVRRQRSITRLTSELSIARRFQGGLRGEMVRMHQEMQLAAMVQKEFLPQTLPAVHGVSFGAMWRPAHYVSGDIYDVSRLDENHIGVFIADAVGHGVPAALMTMVIARSLPTKEVDGRDYRLVPPAEALARLNQEMIRRQGDTTRFATAIYALVNCRERSVRIAGAGHPTPFILREGGGMEAIETEGGLLGVFPDEDFPERQLQLATGDTMLFYSDGFEVAFHEDASNDDLRKPSKIYLEEFERLRECTSAEGMIDEISQRVNLQPGSLHQQDDLTLICMHAGEVSKPSKPRHEALLTEAPAPA